MKSVRGAALLLAATVAACSATPNEIRQKAPRLYQSIKPAALVAACIVEQYEGNGAGKLIQTSPRSDGGTTIKSAIGHVETVRFVIDITPTTSGSRIAFFENTLVNEHDRRYVASCGTPL